MVRVLGLLLALVAPAAMAGALPVGDFARTSMLRSPAISPDGQYLALSLHNDHPKWNEAEYQLVVFHLPELTGVSKLNMAQFYQPAQIVWVSNTRLVVSLAYTSGSLEVPQMTGEIVALDYNGDHKQTLYAPNGRGSINTGIHSSDMPLGYASIAGVPNPRNGHIYLNLSLAPEHRALYAESDRSEVYDVDTTSGKPVLMGDIDQGNMAFVVHAGVARFAYGSHDAHTVEVYARKDASQPWQKLSPQITGQQMTPLRISRDGGKLWSLYSGDGGPQQLIETDLQGQGRKVLAADPFASVGEVLWDNATGAPYAAVFDDARPHLSYLGDSLPAQVLKALNAKFPDHLVTLAGMDDADKHMLVSAESDRDPGTVAMFDTDTMALRPLYQVADWIHGEQLAERKPFRFKASDGVELEGYLTLPKGSSGHALPTVLLPHGGPIGIKDHWTYDADAQFLASRGYAVVQVNYRGSSGRGPAFELSGYKHFGDRIQQDIHDGLQWAIDQGYADKNRVCVYGGSFGGYSALMQPILFPGQYKCAIDYAGVSDWSIGFRKSDTSKFSEGRTYFAQAIGDEAAAKAISPLYQLDKFNVPVLIAHGKDDPRVPYQNATDLRAALDKAGKPYEWLAKPKEGHGFYATENREDMYRHMEAFLAKYLGP